MAEYSTIYHKRTSICIDLRYSDSVPITPVVHTKLTQVKLIQMLPYFLASQSNLFDEIHLPSVYLEPSRVQAMDTPGIFETVQILLESDDVIVQVFVLLKMILTKTTSVLVVVALHDFRDCIEDA